MTDPIPLLASYRETWNVLNTILSAMAVKLECAGNPVQVTTVEPGEPVGDYACQGHAYVRLIRGHMLDPFPNQTLDPKKCNHPGFLVGAGVLRCAPTMDSNANSPRPEVQTELAHLQISDMSCVYEVLRDWRPAGFPGNSHMIVLDTWEPVEPSGGVAGGEWQFWVPVQIQNVCTCAIMESPGESPEESPGESPEESPGESPSEA